MGAGLGGARGCLPKLGEMDGTWVMGFRTNKVCPFAPGRVSRRHVASENQGALRPYAEHLPALGVVFGYVAGLFFKVGLPRRVEIPDWALNVAVT